MDHGSQITDRRNMKREKERRNRQEQKINKRISVGWVTDHGSQDKNVSKIEFTILLLIRTGS